MTNPLLLLVQSQVEGELGALEEQYNTVLRSSRAELRRQDSDTTPTYNQVSPDILGSQESLLSLQEHDSLASRGRTCSLASGGITSFSSSYTSWTRPMAGHRVSDSCVPSSSILDLPHSPMPPPPPPSSLRLPPPPPSAFPLPRSRRKSRPSRRSGKRDSSCDTSKDIDDIEDFDLDEFEEDSDEGSYEVEEGGREGGEGVGQCCDILP